MIFLKNESRQGLVIRCNIVKNMILQLVESKITHKTNLQLQTFEIFEQMAAKYESIRRLIGQG